MFGGGDSRDNTTPEKTLTRFRWDTYRTRCCDGLLRPSNTHGRIARATRLNVCLIANKKADARYDRAFHGS